MLKSTDDSVTKLATLKTMKDGGYAEVPSDPKSISDIGPCLWGRDIVPLGRTKNNFNYNLDEKRVLNFENVVNDDDNIKQDLSIDVYGRAEKEEGALGDAEAPAAAKVELSVCIK